MNRIKVWPHITLMAVAVALIAAVGVAFWMKQEQIASSQPSRRLNGQTLLSLSVFRLVTLSRFFKLDDEHKLGEPCSSMA